MTSTQVPRVELRLLRQVSTTVFFKAGTGDYSPFAATSIARFVFNTSLLAPGVYVFTPVGQEFTNSNTSASQVAAPGSFTLTVRPVPEPASVVLLVFGGSLLTGRRRQFGSA